MTKIEFVIFVLLLINFLIKSLLFNFFLSLIRKKNKKINIKKRINRRRYLKKKKK